MWLPAYLYLGLSLAMAMAWAIARRPGKSGYMDAIWSYAMGVAGAIGALWPAEGAVEGRQLLVAALALLWGGRLGTHILQRSRGGHDDPRYADLRREWGDRANLRLFWFAHIQALAALLLVTAPIFAARNPAPLGQWSDWAGALILAASVLGEGLADAQLKAFRASPTSKGKVCEVGLWGLSRHPNYFFEWTCWLAWPVIAIGANGDFAHGWPALTGAIVMYVLLVHMSGIPPLEAHMLRSRGAAFADTQRRIRAFWPIPRLTRQNPPA